MPTHLNNRFWHVEAEASIDDWITNYAEVYNTDPRVVAYLKYAPQFLLSFDPRSKEAAFPSPRSWVALATMLDWLGPRVMKLDPALLVEYCGGHVGKVQGTQFAGFLRMYHTMVSLEQIKLEPTKAPVPSEPSVCYAIATALSRQADRKTIEPIFAYLARLPQEFPIIFANQVKRFQPKLQETKSFVTFAATHADLL